MAGRNVGILVDIMSALILSVLLFVFAPEISTGFIVAYAFLMLSVFIQVIPLFLSCGKQNAVYKCTYFSISIMYLLLQTVLSFWGVFWRSNAAGKIALTSMLLFFLYGMAMSISFYIFKQGHRDEMIQKEKRKLIEQAVGKIRICKKRTTDMELQRLCDEAIDSMRYGNAIGTQKLSDDENQILLSAGILEQLSSEHKNDDCKKECHKLLILIQERNIRMNVSI